MKTTKADEEPLISELAYMIVRLHKDMYMNAERNIVPIIHEVVVKVNDQQEVENLR